MVSQVVERLALEPDRPGRLAPDVPGMGAPDRQAGLVGEDQATVAGAELGQVGAQRLRSADGTATVRTRSSRSSWAPGTAPGRQA